MATIHYSTSSLSTSSSSLHRSSVSMIEKTHQQLKQETADIEKFTRFFILKAVQIIVQSRLLQQSHNKVKYPCKSGFSGDWFNLPIEDHPDILSATKSAIGCNNNALLSLPKCVVVEISLNQHNSNSNSNNNTSNNNKLVLEVWKLQLSNNNDFKCPSNNYCTTSPTLYSVYNCMSMLLKSLISITRVLPAYKLCTRLSNLSAEEDDYEIAYEIYTQEEEEENDTSHNNYMDLLGKHSQSNILGSIISSVGVIQLEYAYRTQIDVMNLEISSKKQHVDEMMIMVNQDKQQGVIFPSQTQVPTSPTNTKNSTPAFSDPLPPSFWDTPSTDISESCINLEEETGYKIPFSNLLRRRSSSSSTNHSNNNNTKSRHNSSSSCASSSSETDTQVQNLTSNEPVQEEDQIIPILPSNSNSTNSLNFINQQPSYEVVSMKPLPFAPTSSPASSSSSNDPTSFYNSFINPPSLPTLENPSSSTIVLVTKQINEQLQRFEANAHMFDEFVSKLCSG